MAAILIIEDNPDDRNLLVRALQLHDQSIAIHAASTGAQGLAEARRLAPAGLLVLLDIGLPDLSGEELVRRLRALDLMQAVPIIGLTALAPTAGEVRAIVPLVSAVFQKGIVDTVELLNSVDKVLATLT